MDVNEKFWQITDFSDMVSKTYQEKTGIKETVHYNTVDKWFKELENKGIHYIQRVADKKVYNELDLAIGVYIMIMRAKKWRLEAIFNILAENIDVRSFADSNIAESQVASSDSQVMINEAQILKEFQLKFKEMENEFKESLTRELEQKKRELEQQYISLLPAPKTHEDIEKENLEFELRVKSLLPKEKTAEEIRVEKSDAMIFAFRKRAELEEKAIEEWNKLPLDQRTKKVGFFRREEDWSKRDLFIRKYVRENIEL
jgi:hypothetical protein